MIRVDAGKCIGCGLCVDSCSDIFQMDGQGRATVIKGRTGQDDETVRKIAAACPAGAISLE